MTIDEFLKTGGKIIPHTVYEIRDKDGIDLTTEFWSGQTHWLDKDEMKKFIANRELPPTCQLPFGFKAPVNHNGSLYRKLTALKIISVKNMALATLMMPK